MQTLLDKVEEVMLPSLRKRVKQERKRGFVA